MGNINRVGIVAALVLWLGGLGVAAAQSGSGAVIYSQGLTGVAACAACHGPQGEGLGEFPRLAGLPARYVADQLTAYRDGTRANDVMAAIAKPLDGPEIQVLADYLAGLAPAYLPAPPASAEALTAGARLAALGKWSAGVPACQDCHGPALRGGGPALPGLAGQPEAYLRGQLEAFKSGSRPPGLLGIMGRIAAELDADEIAASAAYAAALRENENVEIPRGESSDWRPHAQDPDSFEPPPESALPPRPEDAAAVLLGERIFMDTPKYASAYAGNVLSCRNCHTDRGRNPVASPVWAAVPIYPQYRNKDKTVNSFALRIEGCFRYSQNGTPPPADSEEMVALMSYMSWLATGLPIGITPKASGYPSLAAPAAEPDRARGATVYSANCAVCHGENGEGRVVAGAQVMPPLWGPQSYNWGAGMHTLDNAAAFVYANMPYGAPGTLSEQQAWDVAAWLNSHPRPQDPRFTESAEKTRELYHRGHTYDYYGKAPDGLTLGAPGTLDAWQARQAAPSAR